jgi:hypothetical protein
MTEATMSSFLLDFVVRAAFLPLDQDWNGRDHDYVAVSSDMAGPYDWKFE